MKKRYSPVHAVQVSLDGVTAIVDQENDWGKPVVNHRGEFLDGKLAGDRLEHQHMTSVTMVGLTRYHRQ